MDTLLQDLRYGYRTLLRNPGFTAIALLSLALGIGANTAIFSFVDTFLLKALPVRDPQSLVLFGEGRRRGNMGAPAEGSMELFAWREYQDLRKGNQVFDDILATDSSSQRIYASFTGQHWGGAPEGLLAVFTSGNFFDVLGVRPGAGQFFHSGVDNAVGANPLAVLSDDYWQRRFRRDPAIVGAPVRIGDREYTVLGVAPRGFFGTRVGESPDLWLPVTMLPEFPSADFIKMESPQTHFMHLIGRLKPGVTLQRASAGVNVLYRQLLPSYLGSNPSSDDIARMATVRVDLNPAEKGLSSLRTRYELPLKILMAVVGLVLLIACANVAGLLVALGAKRQREMAVRLAIGAGRGRVIRQLLTENVLLSSVAGLLGILFASGAGRLLVHLISTGPQALPVDFTLDGRVLAFTIGISVVTGIAFGLAPALRASRADLNTSLKAAKAGVSGRVSLRRALIVGQVALSLTLLITAGLLLHSFMNLVASGTGFDRENVLLFKIDSTSSGYKQDQRLAALYARIEAGLARLPNVVSGGVSLRSFHEGHWGEHIEAPGMNLPEKERIAVLNFVTPAFFSTFHIPLLAGRTFDARDNAGAPLIAVVSETFAKRVFAGLDPVGKSFSMSPLTDKDQQFVVVGVVRDVKTQDVRDKAEKQVYLPMEQDPVYAGTVAVRMRGDQASAAASVRRTLHSIEPNLPIRWTTTLAEEVSDSLVRERAIAQLTTFFAGIALFLSAIGLYGTISFTVARRTNEIGIRMALGAARASVLGMVLRDAIFLAGIGIAVGIPLSVAAEKVMQSILFGVGSFDVFSTAVAIAVLGIVAVFAGLLPARRAANVDPMTALRYE